MKQIIVLAIVILANIESVKAQPIDSIVAIRTIQVSFKDSIKPIQNTKQPFIKPDATILNNSQEPDPAISKPVEVIEVYSKKFEDNPEKKHTSGIGEIIIIRVSNIDSLIRRSKCQDTKGNELPAGTCKQQKMRLFVNGRMMVGIVPEKGEPERLGNGEGAFHFRLERNEENDKIWADILGSPTFNKDFFIVPVKISVGLENEYSLLGKNDDSTKFYFERIHKWWFWFSFIGIIIIISGVIVLAKKGLLRDRIIDLRDTGIWNPDPSALNRQFSLPPTPPYSLGRFQMAFWFVLVIVSFLFIWLITDAYNILNASVLALIGISAGTSLSATIIDNNKKHELIAETKRLQEVYDDPATPPTERQQSFDKMNGNIKQLVTEPSRGFFKDILEDANGISFHRWQMLAWTIVFGLLFMYTVWKRLSMPDFDPVLLALQGITAGTYLGFKFPEKHN